MPVTNGQQKNPTVLFHGSVFEKQCGHISGEDTDPERKISKFYGERGLIFARSFTIPPLCAFCGEPYAVTNNQLSSEGLKGCP